MERALPLQDGCRVRIFILAAMFTNQVHPILTARLLTSKEGIIPGFMGITYIDS